LAGEGVAAKILAEQVVAVDAQAAGGGRLSGRAGELEELQLLMDRIELVRSRSLRDEDARVRRCHVRVAAQGVVGERVVPARGAVVAAEPVAPVVTHPALLRSPRGRLDLAGVRLDAEVAVAEVQHLAGLVTLDLAAEQPARAVDPAVQTVL